MNGYNFTERVRKVLAMAREEAARLHHEYVGTEHILLGLIREGEGVAATVLQNLSVELEEIQQKIEETVKKGKAAQATGPDLPYTSRAKKVLELAMSEARELGHSYVANRNDVKVAEITLWLFGGVAKLEGDADDAKAEFRIAAAGPAMSFVCAAVCAVGFWLVERWDGSEVFSALLVWLAAINLVLAVSNLLPAFPLDAPQAVVIGDAPPRDVTAAEVNASPACEPESGLGDGRPVACVPSGVPQLRPATDGIGVHHVPDAIELVHRLVEEEGELHPLSRPPAVKLH